MNRKKLGIRIMALLLGTVVLAGCGNKAAANTISEKAGAEVTKTSSENKTDFVVTSDMITYDKDDYYTDWKSESPNYIELSGNGATVKGAGAVVEGSKITINSAGVYALSGKLENGQIIIDVKDKETVKLVLNGVEINSLDNSPVYVKDAGKIVISLEEGTENTITDGEKYALEGSEEEPNSAIFSKANLTINGGGTINVHGNYNNGITSKDDLKITGGNINIYAKDDGLMGKDMLIVKEGNINIEAGGDGLKATNDTEASKGFVGLQGGSFNIKSTNDGIQAETSMLIEGGNYTIVTGGGSSNAVIKAKAEAPGMKGSKGDFGNINPNTNSGDKANANGNTSPNTNNNNTNTAPNTNGTTTNTAETEKESAKGIKATSDISITGGSFSIDSSDDSIHSNNTINIASGDINITSGDDGIHADSAITVKAGKINITKSYEGIESTLITFDGGETHVVASDDGVNVGGGADGSSVNGRPGQNNLSTSGNNKLNINGGYLWVNSTGDGLDSNGSIYMNGGTVIVSGPTANNNGALDYDGEFLIKGGFLVSAGSSGMAQAPSDSSTQNSIAMSLSSMQEANKLLVLKDSKGNTMAAITPEKQYGTVVISSPELKKGEEYTIYSGGTMTGTATDGLYKEGEHKDGSKIVTFNTLNITTWVNESGVSTAPSGHQPGGGGKMRPQQ